VSDVLAVTFLACNKNPALYRSDASFLYRCENLAAALAAQGHLTACQHITQFSWQSLPDVVVFHRPQFTARFWLLFNWLKQHGVHLVADVDDLVFRPDLASISPGVTNGQVDVGTVRRLFGRHWRALRRFSRITTSTAALRDELQSMAGRADDLEVTTLPNAVHLTWRTPQRDLEAAGPTASRIQGVRPILRYLPGTHSHDRDFGLIVPVLRQVLMHRPQVQLEVVGPLDFQLDLPASQVLRRDKQPFAHYHHVVQGTRINLAPLELTPFTRCKSALKVIEAAYWNVPTVCSAIPDARRLAHAGACMAETPDQWRQWLTALLDEDAFYAEFTQGLRQRILAHADAHALARIWLDRLGRPRHDEPVSDLEAA
jgi:glycosyltransferase involved in cell wall biosynthesis